MSEEIKPMSVYRLNEEPEQLRKPEPEIKPGTIVEVWNQGSSAKRIQYATGNFGDDGSIYTADYDNLVLVNTPSWDHYRIVEVPEDE